jgi:hypothetical protein
MSTRNLTRVLLAISGGNFIPDTGETVQIVDANNTSTVIATATETPSGSGNYVASFTCTPRFGYWKVGATVETNWGKVWLGNDGQLRPTHIFRKVKVYDPGASPTGAKGAANTFVTNTAPLQYDADDLNNSQTNAIETFTNIPLVSIGKNYQERQAFISTDPSLSSGNVTFGISVSDAGDNYSDGKCYCDIFVTSLD